MLQLICAVVDAEAVLVVDICRHQVVAELQERVAAMLTSRGELDFQKLDLYLAKQDGKPGKAWLPFNDELAQLQQGDVPKYITATYMTKELLLDPRSQLSDHFSDAPEAGVVHVLLTTPFCLKCMRKLCLAFLKPRHNCGDDLADVVRRQCFDRNLNMLALTSRGRYGWEFECYESDEDDELAYHQQVALYNDIRARAAKGECILGPAWLFDTYIVDPRNTFVRATMVYIAPKRKVKVVPRPQNVEPCRRPLLGQWLHSVLRWPHDGHDPQETDGSCDGSDSTCGAVGIEMRSFKK